MALLLILALVVLLYIRTLDYKYVIDDNVKRQGYMYEIPLQAPAPDFFNTKPTRIYRLFLIAMHCANVAIIYFIWGWAPALIFAVHPLGVWGTAWVTGNYYATTAFFTLIAFYIMHTFPNVWGALAAMPFYVAALNSTVCAINFPFLFLFIGNPWGLLMGLPLIKYLKGKKFNTGMKIRNGFVSGKAVPREFKINRLILMTKVVARYTYTAIFPDRLGLFGGWGNELMDNPDKYKKMHSADKDFFQAAGLIALVAGIGLFIHPVGTFWFFVIIAVHSQFNVMGQFYAERYLYLPVIGLCVVAGTFLAGHPIALTAIVTALVIRTHFFIPTWKNMETVWRNDIDTYPEFGEVYSNMAQYHMNRKPIPAWRINEIGFMLFKAESMEPNSWKIHMNIACFFAITQEWNMCLRYTENCIDILDKIGGTTPIEVLRKQRTDIMNIIEQQKAAMAQQEAELNQGRATVSLPITKEGTDDTGTKEQHITEGISQPV